MPPESEVADQGVVTVPHGTRYNVGPLLIGYGGRLVAPDRAMLSVLPPGEGPRAEHLTLEVGEEQEVAGYAVRLVALAVEHDAEVARVSARAVTS